MFGRNKNDNIIDAAVELERHDQDSVEGERGASELGSQRRQSPAGAKTFLIIILACAAAIGGTFTWKAWQVRSAAKDQPKQATNSTVRNTLPPLTPLAVKPVETPPDTTPNASVPPLQPSPAYATTYQGQQPPAEKTPAELLRERRLSAGLVEGEGVRKTSTASQQASSGGPGPSGGFGGGGDNELQNKLQPLRLNPSSAGTLGNRDYLLTQGAMIDCQLETMLITTQPGMTSCYATRDIYSANGRVVLIDRGSKIVGNYQGGMKQGEARIFVLWSRIETPKGVIVNLDSPGTGPLGEGGVGGKVDTHFWERFGGAIMISLIGDLGQYASSQGKNGGGNTIQFGNTAQGTQQAAAEALKNSINIPPTLYKHQGERISIFVARDLDFGGVYALEHE